MPSEINAYFQRLEYDVKQDKYFMVLVPKCVSTSNVRNEWNEKDEYLHTDIFTSVDLHRRLASSSFSIQWANFGDEKITVNWINVLQSNKYLNNRI